MARLDALKHLDESSILMTQDWAMKFLPQKFRESQTDWFTKRGISWHISVVAIKKDGKLFSQAFVHVVENCNQDASVVVRIIKHVLRTLKQENPDISKAFLRSDNAGRTYIWKERENSGCIYVKDKNIKLESIK